MQKYKNGKNGFSKKKIRKINYWEKEKKLRKIILTKRDYEL